MAATLAYSVVLSDGTVAVLGTPESPELREQVTNPEAWAEAPEAPSKSSKSTSKSK